MSSSGDEATLRRQLVRILDAHGARVTSAAYVLDQLDRQGTEFSLDEFDATLRALRADGEIRIRNRSAPRNDWQLERTAP